MKYVLYMNTGSDSDEAEQLQDCLRGKLRNVAVVRNITDLLAEEQDFRKELPCSECVVLIGSRQASSLIQNKQQEIDEDGFITFDGKVIHDEFARNKELVDRLIIVYFTERTKNDWIPTGLDERKIFYLQGQKLRRGNPILDQLGFFITSIVDGKTSVGQMMMP